MPIKNFTDLNAWKQAHQLSLAIYKSTQSFPKSEQYCLTQQIRRCVISVTSNIAEGFSRNTINDKRQFYAISRGSLTELQNQLLLARDLGYLDKVAFNDLAEQTVTVSKLITGLYRSANNRI